MGIVAPDSGIEPDNDLLAHRRNRWMQTDRFALKRGAAPLPRRLPLPRREAEVLLHPCQQACITDAGLKDYSAQAPAFLLDP